MTRAATSIDVRALLEQHLAATRAETDGTRDAVAIRARPRWGSARAAMQSWADYRLAAAPVRSTSDFSGSGGGSKHAAPLDLGMREYTEVVEVDRAVGGAFAREQLPHQLRAATVTPVVLRVVFVLRVVGRPVAVQVERPHAAGDGTGRVACASCGGSGRHWRDGIDPRTGLASRLHDVKCERCAGTGKVRVTEAWMRARGLRWVETDVHDVARDHGLTMEQTGLVVRHGLAEVTDALARCGLVPPRRRKETPMAAPKPRERQTKLLSGWKEIGRYIGRDGRTARRWAKQGMPISRDRTGWPIADPSEIDAWRRGQGSSSAA